MSDNAEAAARRARAQAHRILELPPEEECDHGGEGTRKCNALRAYILTTEARLAAAEAAARGARAGALREAVAFLDGLWPTNPGWSSIEQLRYERGERRLLEMGTRKLEALAAEPPGEGAGALTPGTGRGGES